VPSPVETIAIVAMKQPSRCAKAFDMAIVAEKCSAENAKKFAFTGRRSARNFSLRCLGKDFEAEERQSF